MGLNVGMLTRVDDCTQSCSAAVVLLLVRFLSLTVACL